MVWTGDGEARGDRGSAGPAAMDPCALIFERCVTGRLLPPASAGLPRPLRGFRPKTDRFAGTASPQLPATLW